MKINSHNRNTKTIVVTVLMLIVLHSLVSSISLKAFINITALEIIFGGLFLSIIVSFSFETLLNTFYTIKSSFSEKIDYSEYIHHLHRVSIQVKRDGPLSISNFIEDEEDVFLRDAMILLNDYKKTSAIKDILEKDIDSRLTNLYTPYNVLKMVSHIAPAFGLTGTLLGLIGLLSHINETNMIMYNMASALVSTLYGSLIANFIAVPLMGKTKNHIDQNILKYNIIKEGILLISQNDSPRNVFDTMNVMLREDERLEYPTAKRSENIDEFFKS